MFLYSRSTEPPARSSHESNGSSSAESLNKSDVGKLLAHHSSEIVTQQPVHSESEQTSKSS